jgi:flagellar assembly factor FliW
MIMNTLHFGPLTIDESAALEFPQGLPGFEDCRRFAGLEHPARKGLIFLQSLDRPDLCLLTLPVNSLRPEYELAVSAEDRELLGLPVSGALETGGGVAALAILSFVEGEEPTANLLAPVVIHVKARRAVQAIRPDGRYQVREALSRSEVTCS